MRSILVNRPTVHSMRFFRIFFLFFALAACQGLDAQDADLAPLPAGVEWLPVVSSASGLNAGELAELHRDGFSALSDLAQPPEKGLGCYIRIASVLAESHDTSTARDAYMEIVRELAGFSLARSQELLPADLLEGAASLATTADEKALVHFLSGWELSGEASAEKRVRAGAEFAEALAMKPSPMRTAMLWLYVRWALGSGYGSIAEDGSVSARPDYEKALAILEEIAASGSAKDSGAAQNLTDAIRTPILKVHVSNAFRPGSQAQMEITRRNCPFAEIAIYPLDPELLPASIASEKPGQMAARLAIPAGLEPIRRLTSERSAERPYYPVAENVQLDELMLPGTYLVRASGAGIQSSDFLFITDSILLLKAGRTRLLAFSCNATSGRPFPGADVAVLARRRDDTQWVRVEKRSDAVGVAEFNSADFQPFGEFTDLWLLAFSTSGEHRAMALCPPSDAKEPPALQGQVIADAADYRAGGRVHVVTLLRSFAEGDCAVPDSPGPLRLLLSGPPGFAAKETFVRPGPSGMTQADFDLPADAPAGMYALALIASSGEPVDGAAASLTVESALEPGLSFRIGIDRQDSLVPGEVVTGSVHVASRYGVPVQGQNLEISVQSCDFDALSQRQTGPWQNIAGIPSHSNALGEAAFSFRTDASTGDALYRVSASALDTDGAPVRASETVTVARQLAYPVLSTDRVLFRENDRVETRLTVRDAFGKPAACEGTLRLYRESWREVWVDRRGHEISGEEMQALRRRSGGWFNFGLGRGDYVLKTQGYVTEIVSEIPFSSAADGSATHLWENAGPGYYRYVWIAQTPRGAVVSNEAPFWVSGPGTEVGGYRSDSIRLVLNDPPVDPSGLPVMVAAPAKGQDVLLLSGADDIDSWRMVTMKGSAQLLSLPAPISPNAYLEATGVGEEQVSSSLIMIRAPRPERLSVKVETPQQVVSPGAEASFEVSVRDVTGGAVAGADVVLFVSGLDGTAPSGCPDLFPALPKRFSVRGASSEDTLPFFRPEQAPLESDNATAAAPDDGSGNSDQFMEGTTASGITPVTARTDDRGLAVITVRMPGRIAKWLAIVVASATDGGAGEGFAPVGTSEPLSLTLTAPPFAHAGDEIGFSASLTNHSATLRALSLTERDAGLAPFFNSFKEHDLDLPAGESASYDWRVSFDRPGSASVNLHANADGAGAKAVHNLAIAPDPFLTTDSASACLEEGTLSLAATGNARESAQLFLSASPSRVALAALPHLLEDTSAGSTEAAARLSAVSCLRRLFLHMRYSPEDIETAMRNCGAAEYQKSRQDADVEAVLAAQAKNGAWGWLSPSGTDASTTACNMMLLNLCDGPVAERLAPALQQARDYAATQLVATDISPDVQALLLYALAGRDLQISRPSRLEAKALVNLMRMQEKLGSLALSALTLCAVQYGFDDEAAQLASALRARAVIGAGSSGRSEAYWEDSGVFGGVPASRVEVTSMAVLALLSVHGSGDEIVPMGLSCLYSASRAQHWDGSRETVLALLAFRDVAMDSLETDVRASCVVSSGGKPLATYDSARENRPGLPDAIALPVAADAGVTVSIGRAAGGSPVYATVVAERRLSGNPPAFSRLPGVEMSRKILRVTQVPTLLRGFDEKVVETDSSTILKVGERVEIVILIDVARTLPRAIIEQPIPGFSTLHPLPYSGTGLSCPANPSLAPGFIASLSREGVFRLGVENLPAGRWEIRIPLRVDFPGVYAAAPAILRVPQRDEACASTSAQRIRCEEEPR
jgi:hypothetical protein